MTAGILIKWLADVIYPHTKGNPAALILDAYSAHWTDYRWYSWGKRSLTKEIREIELTKG